MNMRFFGFLQGISRGLFPSKTKVGFTTRVYWISQF